MSRGGGGALGALCADPASKARPFPLKLGSFSQGAWVGLGQPEGSLLAWVLGPRAQRPEKVGLVSNLAPWESPTPWDRNSGCSLLPDRASHATVYPQLQGPEAPFSLGAAWGWDLGEREGG